MICPFCSFHDTRVVDSRLWQEENIVKRRRKCDSCQRRFTTYERFELTLPVVIKHDGRRENYSREKILSGIKKACYKRPVPIAQIERLANNVEKAIFELNFREVSTRDIGNLVMRFLKELDPVAYVRFASVYKTFKDIDEFVNDLKLDDVQGVDLRGCLHKDQLQETLATEAETEKARPHENNPET